MERVKINYNIPKLPKDVILQVIKEDDGFTVALNNEGYNFIDYADAAISILAQLAASVQLSGEYKADDFVAGIIRVAKMRTAMICEQLGSSTTMGS